MKDLSKYRCVGWDFDGTLVDHQRSQLFADYVKANPHNQEFHIVTFRSHGMEDAIDRDMDYLGLTRDHFVSVVNIPDETYLAYYLVANGQSANRQAVLDYICWKGSICKDIGAGILIDDMTDMVITGCQKFDIDHAHPDDVIIPEFLLPAD